MRTQISTTTLERSLFQSGEFEEEIVGDEGTETVQKNFKKCSFPNSNESAAIDQDENKANEQH